MAHKLTPTLREDMPDKLAAPVQEPLPDGEDSYFRTDHLEVDLGRRTARGGAVTIGSQGLKFFISMGSTIVLARLLTPQDYGLVGMVAIVTGFVSMFKDFGLSAATIQKAEVNDAQISTLFWVNVTVSVVIMLLTVAISPAVARFYAEPRLTKITMAFAVGLLLGGLTVQHEALLRRQMRFALLAVIEIVALLTGFATAVLLAWLGKNYWALVFSHLSQGLAYAVAVWLACGWRPGLPVRNSGVRSLLAFGRNLTGFSIVNYFARNLDNMLIGRFWGSEQLGLYARAYQLLTLPIDQINAPITSVAVPALSRLTDSPERYRRAYLRLVEKIAMLTMPLMAFMIATSDWVVLLLLGPRWIGVSRIFALLAVAGFVQPICSTAGWLFITQSRTHHMLQWGLIGSPIIIVSILAGLPWGAVGVAATYAFTFLFIVAPALFWFVGRSGPVRARDFYVTLGPSALASICALLISISFRRFSGVSSGLIGIASCFLVTVLGTFLVLAALPTGRRALIDARDSILLLLRKGSVSLE